MDFKLERPIFIEESFVIPLFDFEFEKELLNVSDHLAADVEMIYSKVPEQLMGIQKYTPNGEDKDSKLVEDTQAIISELVRINRELIKHRASTLQKFPTGLRPFAKAPIFTENNHCRLGMCMRQLQQLYFISVPPSTYFQDVLSRLEFLNSFLVHNLWGEEEYLDENQILCKFYKALRIERYKAFEERRDNSMKIKLNACPKCGADRAWAVGKDGERFESGAPYKIKCLKCRYESASFGNWETCKEDWNNKLSKPKTVAYDYLFNYFGGDTYNGRIVTAASITLAIRCYKDGVEVKFDDNCEPEITIAQSKSKKYLCGIFDVSIDRENIFKISRNLNEDNLFKFICGYDKIEYDIVDYSLDVAVGLTKDTLPLLAKKLPQEFQDLPVCEPVEITENVFREFISSHIGDFDISDNKTAQCAGVRFIDQLPESCAIFG